jgi:DNA-binding Xre family transcriptional regulator
MYNVFRDRPQNLQRSPYRARDTVSAGSQVNDKFATFQSPIAQMENSGSFQQVIFRYFSIVRLPMKDTTLRPVVPIPVDQRAKAIGQIRTAMIEKKMTQAQLADVADCHEKTVQNLLGGRSVRDQTLFDVCMVLGLNYEDVRDNWHGSVAQSGLPSDHGDPNHGRAPGGTAAPVYMGAYTRDAVDHYLGTYLTLRPAFSSPGKIVAYKTEITWDDGWPSLLFQESDRPDAPYSHRGRLYVPASSSFIHLVSLTKGAMRMIVVSQLDRDGLMRGLITTLNKQRATYVPVATPIVYAKRDAGAPMALGDIAPGHAAHGDYAALLRDTISEGYARLVAP